MAVVTFLAWKRSRSGFTRWHMTVDNRYSLCGRQPDGLLSVWRGKKPPPPTEQCRTCREYEARTFRKGNL